MLKITNWMGFSLAQTGFLFGWVQLVVGVVGVIQGVSSSQSIPSLPPIPSQNGPNCLPFLQAYYEYKTVDAGMITLTGGLLILGVHKERKNVFHLIFCFFYNK